MKTKINKQKSCILAIVFMIFVSGGQLSAQSDLEEFSMVEMNNALIRLSEIMKAFEDEILYEAPEEIEEDVNIVLDRLEIYSAQMYEDIMYDASDYYENVESIPVLNEKPLENITDLGKVNRKNSKTL